MAEQSSNDPLLSNLLIRYAVYYYPAMPLDLFTPIVPPKQRHPNFNQILSKHAAAVRTVINDWAENFIDRDGKFVDEFQRSFNSSFWELYLFAVLKSLDIQVDFSRKAPDFVCPKAGLAIEAVIAGQARGGNPEGERTLDDLMKLDISNRYLETLARLSNALDAKVRKYRESYAKLPHMDGLSYVIAIHNFGTPDAHQLGDVAMQRLLYDVWEEESFLKDGRVSLPTGLFLNDQMADVSAVLFSSLATFGKARALSNSNGQIVIQAFRIRNNIEPIHIVAPLKDYRESLRDGLRLFHNPFAARPLPTSSFAVDDVREFMLTEHGELVTTCNPQGDLCIRQIMNLVREGD